MSIYSNPTTARQGYRNYRRNTLGARINQTFVMMRALENHEKSVHSDAVHEWQAAGSIGDVPKRSTPPLTRLGELFNGIFPRLRLQIDADQLRVSTQGGPPYPVSLMSDGEKQVFTLLADIAVLTNERSIFFVDEPELNLHPILAEKVWASIEDAYPTDVFVYATHSLSFALRSGVDAVFAIGHGKIDRTSMTSNLLDLRPFLGSIPGIVRAKKCLFVEGDELSFDAPFYQWILGQADIEVCPVGPSSEVVAAAARDGVWNQIAAGIRVAGIIDRDFKSGLMAQSVTILEYHEAESFLCHPDVIVAIQRALGNAPRVYSRDEVIDELVELARSRMAFIVAQRVFSRTSINLRLSIDRSSVARISTIEELRPLIIAAARSESQKADAVFDQQKLDAAIVEEETKCRAAIENRDVEHLLRLFEGKRALQSLCKMAGCATPLGLLNAAKKHLSISEFAHLSGLRTSLLSLTADRN